MKYMINKKDYNLFISLLLWSLVPSIYLLFRMKIVIINNVDINILGQMEWFDLIDEIVVTILTVPLYFLLKPESSDKDKNGFAFIVSFFIYLLFTVLIVSKVSSIAEFMNAEYAHKYLLLQSISLLISFISTFMIMLFTLNNDSKIVKVLLVCKILFLILCDYIFIKKFRDIGASYSEIIVNTIISLTAISLCYKREYIAIGKSDKSWVKDWLKVGSFSGIQIFLDNYIYAIMIVKMVNVVNESGNYWVANNFIWGWLLVPVFCISEIIKKNKLEKLTFSNTWKYGLYIFASWIITMPLWSWFISNMMSMDANVILSIVMPNIPFYITYIVSAFIDSWFISKGKTIYNMLISLIVNIVYYGIMYILFTEGFFTLNMRFIILLFGGGMIVHVLLSVVFYNIERRLKK